MRLIIMLCSLLLAGCALIEDVQDLARVDPEPEAVIEQQSVEDKCPPLPTLAQNPTPFERRLWSLTVIALYAQCAESKK